MRIFTCKMILSLTVLMVNPCFLWSQTDTLQVVYFEHGQISAIQTTENNRQGVARAYNQKGELIYERHTRQYAGSASVQFSFHANKALRKADYLSHPDGGVQWLRITSLFSEEGELTNEIKDGYDIQFGVTTSPNEGPTIKEELKRQLLKEGN